MVNDTPNKVLRDTLVEINQDLKEGKDGGEVYGKHANVLGKFTAYMLGIASSSGNMVQIYDSTAKFLERTEDFKRNLRKALVMPTFTIFACIGALIYYVMEIFPKTGEMFTKFGINLPPMTSATLKVSHFLLANYGWMLPALFVPIIVFVLWTTRTTRGRLWMDKVIIHIPVIGPLLHKMSIEIYARVFYALYAGSGQNIERDPHRRGGLPQHLHGEADQGSGHPHDGEGGEGAGGEPGEDRGLHPERPLALPLRGGVRVAARGVASVWPTTTRPRPPTRWPT